MDIYYCHWNLRKIQFSNFFTKTHIMEIPTKKGANSYKLKISKRVIGWVPQPIKTLDASRPFYSLLKTNTKKRLQTGSMQDQATCFLDSCTGIRYSRQRVNILVYSISTKRKKKDLGPQVMLLYRWFWYWGSPVY